VNELPNARVVVALGKIAFDAWLRFVRRRGLRMSPLPQFAHGATVKVSDGPSGPHVLIGCYHPSRQNTNTGKLTPAMMTSVFKKARKLIEA
jgi:uracil-DNA glycosylase